MLKNKNINCFQNYAKLIVVYSLKILMKQSIKFVLAFAITYKIVLIKLFAITRYKIWILLSIQNYSTMLFQALQS